MEHKPFDELRTIAKVHEKPVLVPRTRQEKLECWAAALEREPQRRLKTLHEVEFAPRADRAAMRSDDSPLTVAFADPVLRTAGLKNDSYGEALGFFEMTEGEAHRLLCSCLNGHTMEAGRLAERVRGIAAGTAQRSAFAAVAVPIGLALPLLVYLVR